MKVLALDYGAARTGVAISDATGTLARPLVVVERAASAAGLRELAELVAAEGAELIVVGLPLTLKGDHGAQADETAQFVEAASRRRRRARRVVRRAVHDGARRVRPVLAGARGRAGGRTPARELPGVDEPDRVTSRHDTGRPAGGPPRGAAGAASWRSRCCWAMSSRSGGSAALGDEEAAPPRDDGGRAEAGDPPRRLPRGLHAQGDGEAGRRGAADREDEAQGDAEALRERVRGGDEGADGAAGVPQGRTRDRGLSLPGHVRVHAEDDREEARRRPDRALQRELDEGRPGASRRRRT